ncbi:MAG: RDD family protein [Alphaproteobacteria bacterium]|nr:RDD family protein [Alphaproteobacteria bacterium]
MSQNTQPLPAMPAPFVEAQFQGLRARRFVAHMLDWFLLLIAFALAVLAGVVLTVLSLGLLAPFVFVSLQILGFLYFVLFTGTGSGATPGMRAFDLELRDIGGGSPIMLQACIRALLYFVTWAMTGGLLFVWMLFDARGRAVHDILTSSVVVRRRA